MPMIQIRNVSKAYYTTKKKDTARIVLDNVSIEFQENEFVCLVGPSGCGKTTILNMIAGFESPTVGEITFKGEKIIKSSPERGVVFQEYSLLPWMSVIDNIMFALECKGIPEKDRKSIATDALRSVDLENAADQRPNLLSGGMKQRVAIARLLAMDPDVMLMDEPFSNLDEQTRKKLDEDILNIWKSKRKTIVFVTHNISEAVLLANRIILFSSSPGRVIREWQIPRDAPRDLESDEMIRLKKEIVGAMPLCNCTKDLIKIEVK